MVLKKEITHQIKDLLRKNPQGLSITDIVKEVNINRNTAGRYLENLLVSGQVDMRRLGMAKIYMISQRVPVSAVLSISSELVIQLDSSLRIIFANEPFLKLVGSDSKDLMGKNIEYTPVALIFDELFPNFLETLKDGITGKEWSGETVITSKDIILFCQVAPTVFDDGRKGVSVIFQNITDRKKAELKMEESERQFRLLAENSVDMIGRIKPDYTHTYASPAYTTTLGYHPEEVIGKPGTLFIHPDDVRIMEAAGRALTEQNSSITVRFRSKHKDGHYIWIESHVRAIFDEKTHELSEFYTITQDITERKKAEEALQESEDRYRKLVEISPDAVFLHRGGMIIYANPATFALLGASRSDEIIGKSVLEFVSPEFRDIVSSNIQKDLEGEVSPHVELNMIRIDGTPLIVEGRGVKTFIDGKPAVQVAIRDITKRKHAEMVLRESEGKLTALLESITDIMSMMDKNLTIIWANEPARRYFGNDIIGRKCFEVYHQRQAPCEPYPCHVLRAFQDGKIHHHEVTLMDNHCGKRVFEGTANVALQDNSGKPIAVLETAREITERKKAEEALRESEEMLRLIVDSTEDLIFIQDPEGRYLYFNSAQMYGIPIKQVLGATPYDFVDRNIADRLVERVRKVAKTGQITREESPFVWKGQELWFSDRLSPVKDENGTINAVVTISQNITIRKRAETALRESEATARALLDAPTDSVILMDAKGIILALNETAALRFGKRRDELIGVLADDLLPKEIAHSRRSLISKVLETKKMVRFEDERDGRWFDTVAYPILTDSGDVNKIAIVARDITNLKNAK